MLALASPPVAQQLAGMGQIVFVAGEEMARAVLGSCVGVTIYDPAEKVGALAHVVLPTADGRPGSPGKFAETAIPWMLEAMLKKGALRRRLVAKLTGGSKMFAAQGPFLIGEQNAAEARNQLKQLRIPLAGEHLGGSHGRRITFHGQSGEVTIEVVGQPTSSI